MGYTLYKSIYTTATTKKVNKYMKCKCLRKYMYVCNNSEKSFPSPLHLPRPFSYIYIYSNISVHGNAALVCVTALGLSENVVCEHNHFKSLYKNPTL